MQFTWIFKRILNAWSERFGEKSDRKIFKMILEWIFLRGFFFLIFVSNVYVQKLLIHELIVKILLLIYISGNSQYEG